MRIKRVVLVSVITFLIGGAGGSAYAYITNPVMHDQNGELSLAGLEQIQEELEVEQFVHEQEKLRPDGLEESKVETGSKYTGITYNNVGTATIGSKTTVTQKTTDQEQTDVRKADDKPEQEHQPNNTADTAAASGTISIQEGSLNVRSSGDINGTVIGHVYKGDTVQVVSRNGGWYKIITNDGLQGYVSASYVEITSGNV